MIFKKSNSSSKGKNSIKINSDNEKTNQGTLSLIKTVSTNAERISLCTNSHNSSCHPTKGAPVTLRMLNTLSTRGKGSVPNRMLTHFPAIPSSSHQGTSSLHVATKSDIETSFKTTYPARETKSFQNHLQPNASPVRPVSKGPPQGNGSHGKGRLKCDICLKTYSTRAHVRRHKKEVHLGIKRKPTQKSGY